MALVEIAWILSGFGNENAERLLKEFGITSESKIKQFRTKYKMSVAKEKANQKETADVDYYDLLGDITLSEKIQLNPDMLLPEWCGLLKGLKKSAERKKRIAEMNKHGR